MAEMNVVENAKVEAEKAQERALSTIRTAAAEGRLDGDLAGRLLAEVHDVTIAAKKAMTAAYRDAAQQVREATTLFKASQGEGGADG